MPQSQNTANLLQQEEEIKKYVQGAVGKALDSGTKGCLFETHCL